MFGRQTRAIPSPCKICAVPALYSYFGTIVCQSCKMFFKRNAERQRGTLKCDLDGQCKIDSLNRRVCASCRLEKCFASGMRTDMIRGSRSRKNKTRKRHQAQQSQSSTSSMEIIPVNNIYSSPKLSRSWNLTISNRCTLNQDQWTLLSNLVHCYDEHSGYSAVQRFISDQNNLPVKFRYKTAPVKEFLTTILNRAQCLFEKNQDFYSLSCEDRSILLRTSAIHVASLLAHVVLRPLQLMDHIGFAQSHEILFGTAATMFAQRSYRQVDCDQVVMKLILAIMAYSTLNYSFYSNTSPESLTDTKQVLRIQDNYIELLWRYLIDKYNYNQAVACLSNLIRCIFSVQQAIARAIDIQWYTNVIDTLIQKTEDSLSLN